jgi:hypothetical protein
MIHYKVEWVDIHYTRAKSWHPPTSLQASSQPLVPPPFTSQVYIGLKVVSFLEFFLRSSGTRFLGISGGDIHSTALHFLPTAPRKRVKILIVQLEHCWLSTHITWKPFPCLPTVREDCSIPQASVMKVLLQQKVRTLASLWHWYLQAKQQVECCRAGTTALSFSLSLSATL